MTLRLFMFCVAITLTVPPQSIRALEANPETPTPLPDNRLAAGPYQGTPGAYGATGDQGWPGYPGQPGFPGQKGEKGIRGPDGYPGIPGTPGKRGDMGTPGYPGSYGAKGSKGDSGFPGSPGRTGNMGPRGDMGYPGNPGMPGKLGIKGPPGPQGYPGKNGDDASFEPYSARVTLFAVHSQTSGIPYCPKGTTFLWTGYSFFASKKDYASHMQDLGYAGSCLRKFSSSPFVDCNTENVCYGGSNYLRSTWLSGYDYPPGEKSYRSYPTENTISRCVVCETVSTVIAVHSQAYSIPPCPPYWKGLWTGYSFGMYVDRQGIGVGGEDLLSPGSCLQIFRPVPFVDCEDDGTCGPGYNHQATWLAAIPEGYAYTKPTKSTWKDYSAAEGISKCQVCIKIAGTFRPSSYGNPDDPKYGAGPPMNYPQSPVVTNGHGLGPVGPPQPDGSYPPGYGPEWNAPSIPQYGPGVPQDTPRAVQSPMAPGQQNVVRPPQAVPDFSANPDSRAAALPLVTSTTSSPSSISLTSAGTALEKFTSPSQGAPGFSSTGQSESTGFLVSPDNVATETSTLLTSTGAADNKTAITVAPADLTGTPKSSTDASQVTISSGVPAEDTGPTPSSRVPTASSFGAISTLTANADGVENGAPTSTAVQSVNDSTVTLTTTSNQRSV